LSDEQLPVQHLLLNNNPPKTAPQTELITGEEVIGQVPELQPTNRQYRKPPAAPITTPMIVTQFFFT
jgi:uncharacterized protein affecting Mg2+/Co2+ transport